MKTTVHKKEQFEEVVFNANMNAAIAFGIAMICFLLIYIAFYK